MISPLGVSFALLPEIYQSFEYPNSNIDERIFDGEIYLVKSPGIIGMKAEGGVLNCYTKYSKEYLGTAEVYAYTYEPEAAYIRYSFDLKNVKIKFERKRLKEVPEITNIVYTVKDRKNDLSQYKQIKYEKLLNLKRDKKSFRFISWYGFIPVFEMMKWKLKKYYKAACYNPTIKVSRGNIQVFFDTLQMTFDYEFNRIDFEITPSIDEEDYDENTMCFIMAYGNGTAIDIGDEYQLFHSDFGKKLNV